VAEIIAGVACSHTPQLSMGPEMWSVHSRLVDHMLVDMETRLAEADPRLNEETESERVRAKYAECQAQLARLNSLLIEAKPDVVLIFGDDHREVFGDDCSPAVALYCGDEVWDLPTDDIKLESQRASEWAYHGDTAVKYATAGDLGTHVALTLAESGFDPAVLNTIPKGRSLGHAFTFVKRRLPGDGDWQMLPIWLNAFYQPNRPSAARCFNVGQAVRKAVESWSGNERVAIVASGGLSHYVVDEQFDRRFLEALEAKDATYLSSVPRSCLESGSGEVRMWIAAAGALEGLSLSESAYVPGYRSAAGTGVGLGFAAWS